MKINICRRHTLNYYDFTVQPGMLTGYDANNTPYVTNGYICSDNEINVYFMRGQDKFGKYQWRKRNINSGTDGELYKTILRGVQKRGTATIKYMDELQLEADRWSKKEHDNGSVCYNGCRSNHYNYQMTRPTY